MGVAGSVFKLTVDGVGACKLQRGDQVDRWERPPELMPGWTLIAELVISKTEVVPPMPEPFAQSVARVEWLAPPNLSGDCGTAFRLLVSSPAVSYSTREWPGHGEDDDDLVIKGRLRDGSAVWLIRVDAEIGGDLRSELEETRVAEGTRFTSLAVQHQGDAIFGRTLVPRLGPDGQLRV